MTPASPGIESFDHVEVISNAQNGSVPRAITCVSGSFGNGATVPPVSEIFPVSTTVPVVTTPKLEGTTGVPDGKEVHPTSTLEKSITQTKSVLFIKE